MKTLNTMLVLGLILGTAACASTRRSVTHVRVESDKAYVAYAEWEEGYFVGSNDRSRVKRCAINADNTMKCEEDADINAILNPDEEQPPPSAKKAAPKPEAPPPAAEPAADPAAAPPAEAPAAAPAEPQAS